MLNKIKCKQILIDLTKLSNILIFLFRLIPHAAVEAFLIFANRYQIRWMELNGTLLGHSDVENDYVHVLDYDYANSSIYYADAGRHVIKRVAFAGGPETVIVRHNLPLIEGIAVDWVNK